MSSRRNLIARLRSTSNEGRSRSVTPTERSRQRPSAARRALVMGLVAAGAEVEPEADLMPPRLPPAMVVNRTPGGSLHIMGDDVHIFRTPGGNLRRAQAPDPIHTPTEVPLCSDILERVEAMDVSEDEAEDLFQAAPWHVRRWIKGFGLEDRESSDLIPLASTATENGLGCAQPANGCAQPGTVRAGQNTPIGASVGDDVAVIPEVDVRPSTSRGTATSKPVSRREICEGSDFDSEFDDEFDIAPIESTALAGIGRNIPDNDELEEPIRDVINNIERGMDDEVDRLLGISSDFKWVAGYESFRGVPEQFSGPTPGPLKDYDSPYDAFIDIWDTDIIGHIACETNRYAKQTIETLKTNGELRPLSRLHEWKDTNADEIMVLFGVFMYMGIDPRTSLYEYWKADDYLELPKFKRLLSYNRYILLNKFLHFIDNTDNSQNLLQSGETSSAKRMSPKLMKLAPIAEHLGKKFSSLYNLGPNIAIDESLTLFKGRLSWAQTIRSKAARFGIKSYELCESHTGYMARFQIYTGKHDGVNSDPSLSVDLGGKSTKIVLELLQGLEHRGHCVTMDNFYNSPSLARYLKVQGFDCLGTLRINRRNVPNEIAKVPKNVSKGTIISRHSGDVSIVAWKDSKLVSIISTFHDDSTFVGSKAGKRLVKPICVRDYNSHMGGVDLKDQKLSMYLLERKRGVKWYIKMFKRLMNVSIHNAFVMYVSSLKRRNKPVMTHREFRYELAKSLVEQHRPCRPEISEPVDKHMRLRRDILHVPKTESGRNARKRCIVCQQQKMTKLVRSQCITCGVFLCFENCWSTWHSSTDFDTQETRGRKRTRDIM